MIRRFAALGVSALSALVLCQCGGDNPGPVLMGQSPAKVAEGDALFRKAQAEEAKGDFGDAIDLYDDVATDYPYCNHAGEARYRQAFLLHTKENDIRDAFKAYEKFLSHHPGHAKRSAAVESVFNIAVGAQKGEIQDTYLFFMKDDFSLNDTVKMLAAVGKYAPQSNMAAKAKYAMGEAFLRKEKYAQSVTAFRLMAEDHRSHPLAPEALFRVGKILLENADRGNQNQANIDLSREAFNDYLIQFPGHKHNAEARKMIASLGVRDIQRTMDVADFYYKTGKLNSAKIYYRDVVKRTKSGKLHDRAQARLKEIGN